MPTISWPMFCLTLYIIIIIIIIIIVRWIGCACLRVSAIRISFFFSLGKLSLVLVHTVSQCGACMQSLWNRPSLPSVCLWVDWVVCGCFVLYYWILWSFALQEHCLLLLFAVSGLLLFFWGVCVICVVVGCWPETKLRALLILTEICYCVVS